MKINYILISLVAVLAFSSCNNDFDGFGSVKKGDVIRFVATTSDSNTRTSYGDKDETNNKWPIYWENGDNVRVVCPQAIQANDTKWADFTVNAIDDKQTEYTLTGTNSLSWGEEDAHHFYTFYPKERVYVTDGNTGTYTVAIPREQNAKVTTSGDEINGFIYEAVDMSAAVMAGHAEYKRTAVVENTVINLPFKPLTTAFDVVIKAPITPDEGTTGIESVVITSITIANKANETTERVPLAGGFTYNAKDDSYELYQNTTTNEDAQSYTVNVQLAVPVTLRTGTNDQLTVTAFLLPKDLPKDLRFMVNCREDETSGNMKVQSKTVSITDDQVTANVGKKITLNMGNLPNPIEFSYETWMANLDEDVYVSQISLPGTHDAGAYPSTDEGWSGLFDDAFAQTQLVDIEEQLNAGIRVLDFRPKYIPDDKSFNIAHGYVTYNDRTFDYVFDNAVKWLAKHPTEFIIVQLKNEADSGTESFSGWQANMRAKLLTISSDYLIESFDPEMTLKDARGKILFLSRDFYVGTDGNTADHNHGSWVGGKFNFGIDNNNYKNYIGFYEKYDPYWKPSGVFTSANPTELGEIFTISDLYKGAVLGSGTGLLAPKEDVKFDCIEKTISAAHGDGNINTWYFTYLNVGGFGSNDVSTYNEYTANLISNLSGQTYQRVGVVMIDWACPFSGTQDVEFDNGQGTIVKRSITNEYKGYEVTKAIIDNNFKGGGPAKKSTVY